MRYLGIAAAAAALLLSTSLTVAQTPSLAGNSCVAVALPPNNDVNGAAVFIWQFGDGPTLQATHEFARGAQAYALGQATLANGNIAALRAGVGFTAPQYFKRVQMDPSGRDMELVSATDIIYRMHTAGALRWTGYSDPSKSQVAVAQSRYDVACFPSARTASR